MKRFELLHFQILEMTRVGGKSQGRRREQDLDVVFFVGRIRQNVNKRPHDQGPLGIR